MLVKEEEEKRNKH